MVDVRLKDIYDIATSIVTTGMKLEKDYTDLKELNFSSLNLQNQFLKALEPIEKKFPMTVQIPLHTMKEALEKIQQLLQRRPERLNAIFFSEKSLTKYHKERQIVEDNYLKFRETVRSKIDLSEDMLFFSPTTGVLWFNNGLDKEVSLHNFQYCITNQYPHEIKKDKITDEITFMGHPESILEKVIKNKMASEGKIVTLYSIKDFLIKGTTDEQMEYCRILLYPFESILRHALNLEARSQRSKSPQPPPIQIGSDDKSRDDDKMDPENPAARYTMAKQYMMVKNWNKATEKLLLYREDVLQNVKGVCDPKKDHHLYYLYLCALKLREDNTEELISDPALEWEELWKQWKRKYGMEEPKKRSSVSLVK